MADSRQPGRMVWIVTDDDKRGDDCIRAVYETPEAAYAAVDEHHFFTQRVMAHEVRE